MLSPANIWAFTCTTVRCPDYLATDYRLVCDESWQLRSADSGHVLSGGSTDTWVGDRSLQLHAQSCGTATGLLRGKLSVTGNMRVA